MTETLTSPAAMRAPTPDAQLDTWLATWPAVRADLEALLAAYRLVRPDYDPHWTEWVIAEMDDAVSNLGHRAAWLRTHIAQEEVPPCGSES
jgi:hypothetical protein